MDGDGFRDFFSEPDPMSPSAGFDVYSQPELSLEGGSRRRAPRTGMESLDLNSEGDEFPHLGTYQELLQPGQPELPTRGAGHRLRGLRVPGGRAGSCPTNAFRAPRPDGGRRGASGRGGGRGAGFGTRSFTPGGGSGAVRTSSVDEQDPFAVAAASSSSTVDKAQWTVDHNSVVLCDLCVEQIGLGNYRDGSMNRQGYKMIMDKFYMATGLRHDRKQLKKRIGQLKTMYGAWLWLTKQTGIGFGPDGEVVAPNNKWWDEKIQEKPEVAKFRGGLPPYMDQLEAMFHGVCVDGSTSYIPGGDKDNQLDGEEDGDGDDENGTVPDKSPRSSNSRKRSTSSSTTATSLPKKFRSPMVGLMKMFVDTYKADTEASRSAMNRRNEQAEINECQDLALQCGASPESAEYFVGAILFVEHKHRCFFRGIPTNEGRLAYLKRWCRLKNLYD